MSTHRSTSIVAPALELRLATSIDHAAEFYGVLGVFANAFLSGAFDDIDSGNQWYDHPCLMRRMQFRRESTLQREADWLAEWLALLRMEGATHLRFHLQNYKGFQQHLSLVTSEGFRAPVLSAWGSGLLRERCLSSWTTSSGPSVSRARQQSGFNAFPYPLGTPADLVVDEMLRTEKLLDGATVCTIDVESVQARLDSLYSRGKQGGYVLAEFPSNSSSRVSWALEHLCASAPVDEYHPYSVFPSDPRADAVRSIYIDMALLEGQLAQVPELTPLHPYDDANRGRVYPRADTDGHIYDDLKQGLSEVAEQWLSLCYRPWDGATSLAPDARLNQRAPLDLTYSMYEHKMLLTRPPSES